jgi:hypothetical protein
MTIEYKQELIVRFRQVVEGGNHPDLNGCWSRQKNALRFRRWRGQQEGLGPLCAEQLEVLGTRNIWPKAQVTW